ncbi:hypothetical protein [Amycolatopsis sp. NPDC059657]|uniref:hypothetical protein n=1 Tax=Amycolatopsis sp. NPDC059657 TaxID=3346899 RepID=UPI0036722190
MVAVAMQPDFELSDLDQCTEQRFRRTGQVELQVGQSIQERGVVGARSARFRFVSRVKFSDRPGGGQLVDFQLVVAAAERSGERIGGIAVGGLTEQ